MKKFKIMALLFGFVVSIFGQSVNLDLEKVRQNLEKFEKSAIRIATKKNSYFSDSELAEIQNSIKEVTKWGYDDSLITPESCYINQELDLLDWVKIKALPTLGVNYALVYDNLLKKDGKFSGTITLWEQDPVKNLSWKTVDSFSSQDTSLQELAISLAKKIKGNSREDLEKKVREQEKTISQQDTTIKQLQEDIAYLKQQMIGLIKLGKESNYLKTLCQHTNTKSHTNIIVSKSELVLESGTWLIGYDVCCNTNVSAGTVALQSDKSGVLAGTNAYCYGGATCIENVSRQTELEVSDKDTIKLVIRCVAGNGGFSVLGERCSSESDGVQNNSVVWARKIK